MPKAPAKPYQKLLRQHKKRAARQPDAIGQKILGAMEKLVESCLRALAEEASLTPKEQKELLGLLMKAAGEMARMTPAEETAFNLTPTDKALLELYVQQRRNPGTLPGTL